MQESLATGYRLFDYIVNNLCDQKGTAPANDLKLASTQSSASRTRSICSLLCAAKSLAAQQETVQMSDT